MLILLLRIGFVILAAFVGFGSGQYFYRDLNVPQWFGAAVGFGIAITLIAAEQGYRKRFARSLVAFIVGLGLGLLLSYLLLAVVGQIIQSEELRKNLDVPLVLITTYLVMITVIRGADRFRVVVPFVEFRSDRIDTGAAILAPEALGDPRLTGLVTGGVLTQRLLVHRRVLVQIEGQAAGQDPAAKARARRALDALTELRALGTPAVEIDGTELPNTTSVNDTLLSLARLENSRLVSADPELIRAARAEGISVIDLQTLAGAFAEQIRPGETLSVEISKLGEAAGQGIGHLGDGSMVVVANAGNALGSTIRCTVLRLHSTANGRMVFAERV